MDTSPTGTPRLPPSGVPWVLAAAIGLTAALEAASHSDGIPPAARLACGISAVAFAAALGIISPGWRRPPAP